MNVLMVTNGYRPLGGGVAQAVERYRRALLERGHEVLVVAPKVEDAPSREEGVIRVPAVGVRDRNLAVSLPLPGLLSRRLNEFDPDLVHSHHPFFLGDSALRIAATRHLPLVFTHHSRYDLYTRHWLGGRRRPGLRRFVVEAVTAYENLCQHVVAPSESIARMLEDWGVETPVSVIPTGIDPERFADGDGERFRRAHDLAADARVVGYVGRLVPEKNLDLLARAVAAAAAEREDLHFLLVGQGESREAVRSLFEDRGLADRLRTPGRLEEQPLVDAYHAMDLFAFASTTETQGMVVAEAMAAGTPVVAVDAPGARETAGDAEGGRLVDEAAGTDGLASAIGELVDLDEDRRHAMGEAARAEAEAFRLGDCVDRLIDLYRNLAVEWPEVEKAASGPWGKFSRRLEMEWRIVSKGAGAAADALRELF